MLSAAVRGSLWSGVIQNDGYDIELIRGLVEKINALLAGWVTTNHAPVQFPKMVTNVNGLQPSYSDLILVPMTCGSLGG